MATGLFCVRHFEVELVGLKIILCGIVDKDVMEVTVVLIL